MKPVLAAFLLISISLVSCDDHKKMLAESAVNAKIDSLVAQRMDEVNARAMEDLNRRISIEVKVKADSILAAKNGVPADTANR